VFFNAKIKKKIWNTDQCSRSVFPTLSPFFSKNLPLFSLKEGSSETRIFSLQIHVRKGYPHRGNFGEKKCQSLSKFENFKTRFLKTLVDEGTSFAHGSVRKNLKCMGMLVWARFGFVFKAFLGKKQIKYRSGTLVGIQKQIFCGKKMPKKMIWNTDQCSRSVFHFRFFAKSAPKQTHISSKRAQLHSLDFSPSIYGHFEYSCLTNYGEKWIWKLKILTFLWKFCDFPFDFLCLGPDLELEEILIKLIFTWETTISHISPSKHL